MTEAQERYTEMVETLNEMLETILPLALTGSWVTNDEAEQLAFADVIQTGVLVFEKVLRPKFDSTVNDGHEHGTVFESVVPIRAPRSDDAATPGRKAPTAAEILQREKDKLVNRK